MTSRSHLETINDFWKARLAGDKALVRSFLSADATYELVGANAFADPAAVGPGPAGPAADRLIDDFQFHSLKQLSHVFDDAKAAVVSELEVSFRGGTRVVTKVCDLWEFDGAGQVTSLQQFADTDLLRAMLRLPGKPTGAP